MDRKREWRYLLEIVRYGLDGGDCPCSEEQPDWEYLYRVCKRHRIEGIVCSALEKMPAELHPPMEILEKFRYTWKVETGREAVQQFALEELLDAYEKAGVDCVLLKGILVKKFYPSPELRMMADLDILYRPRQGKRVNRILLSQGYVCDHTDDNHKVYFRKPFMNIEMHHRVVYEGHFSDYYKDIWKRVKLQEGKKHIYCMTWEDFYIYMMVHLVKHFQGGGSGIRSIIDIWQFTKVMKDRLDWKYIERELDKIKLNEFVRHMQKLCGIWFGGGQTTGFYDDLTEFIINSGIYGTVGNSHISRAIFSGDNQRKGINYRHFRATLRIVFLPYENMCKKYSWLKKYPVLLPAAWIYRIVHFCFKKKGKTTEVFGSTESERKKILERKELFDKLALPER